MKGTILIVDDEAMMRLTLTDRLRFWGHETDEAETGAEALEKIKAQHYDVVLLDLKLPDISGIDVLHKLRESGSDTEVVMLTAHGSVEAAIEAIKLGADEFLPKPTDFDLLKKIVERLLAKRSLQRVSAAMVDQSNQERPFVVGEAPAMQELLEQAARAAQAPTTVMLRGESGSGKQVVAEYIHRESPRATGPFVYVNCVALSDELIESTLFGHEKGAFTGAHQRKTGRLEVAHGGTAFLDEIGDITPRLQTKLLHFLETGQFERVGGTQTIRVDCRIVAATNRNLEESIAEGEFREDLFYRLNVITLRVPPLRERADDIPALARSFVDRFSTDMKRGKMKLANKTEEIIRTYRWPGNVRQLKNAMERMVVMARTDTLTPDLLPPEVFLPTGTADTVDEGLGLKEAMAEFKKRHIAKALAREGGNQTKAAQALGIQRTFLNRLIKELEIQA